MWVISVNKHARRSRLCIRCRDQGFILPADPASPNMCRGHLAEERINNLIKERHG
jgi:hypothetical protein